MHLSKFQTFKIDQYITKQIGMLFLQVYMRIFRTQSIKYDYLKKYVKKFT